MIKIPAELKELKSIFERYNKKLYIVGGYVRDSYLGISSALRDDIDLTSSVQPKELKNMLEGTKFKVRPLNEKLGVMEISGNRRFEFATFRKEVYENDSHSPTKVSFISSLDEDAKRRDFKINAIYYDLEEETYVDPLGGIDDLKKRIITTVKVPKIVFNDDPERILRLIRFACALGFSIPEEEYFYAKQNAYKIKFISKSRLRSEFEKLLTADEVYPNLLYTKDAHYRAMVLLGEFDTWKIIMPSMDDIKNSKAVDNKGEPIYDHTLNALKNASPKIRLAVLLHDAAKVKAVEKTKKFFGSKEFIAPIVEMNLGDYGLGYPRNIVRKVIRTIEGYDFDPFCLTSTKNVKKYILNNRDVIENVIEIKTVVKNEGKLVSRRIKSAERLRKVFNEMIKKNTPFERADLKIKGDEIINLYPKIRTENIDTLIDKLLENTAISPEKNTRESLVKMMDKIINSNRDFYLE